VRSELLAGARDGAPAVPPGIVLAVLFGATAVEVGFSPAAATALSLLTFAGVAQMAAVELLRGDAQLSIVLLTFLLINVRYVIYSATLSVQASELSGRWRAVLSYALFDVNFALVTAQLDEHTDISGRELTAAHGWYYAGATAVLVGSFAAATLVGALAGQVIDENLGLSFAIPLIFVALVIPRLTDRAAAATAAVAAAVAVLTAGSPFNLGLLAAATCGTIAGTAAEQWSADSTGTDASGDDEADTDASGSDETDIDASGSDETEPDEATADESGSEAADSGSDDGDTDRSDDQRGTRE
jgi:predicted branched-subunit amino acid permease